MTKFFLILITILIVFGSLHSANPPGKIGIGIILGDPTGISFKSWQSNQRAIDAALAWSLGKENAFHIHADYLFHNYRILRSPKEKLSLYFGLGGRLESNGDTALGVRIPIGITYVFETTPIDLFVEFVPSLNLIPATDFDLEGGIGARFYF